MFNSFLIRLQSLEDNNIKEVSKEIYKFFSNIVSCDSYYTVSNFLSNNRYNLDIQSGKYYLFRVTTLDVNVFGEFTSHLFKKKILNNTISIGNIEFIVKEIICDEAKSKYVQRFDNEYLRYINSDDCDIDRYKLKVTSPMIFKVGSKIYNDIDSEMIFRNLLTKFNKYSGYNIDKEFVREFNNIDISVSNERHSKLKVDKAIVNGVSCDMCIELGNLSSKAKYVARTLIEFGVYSGIGYKSELGYGQVYKE